MVNDYLAYHNRSRIGFIHSYDILWCDINNFVPCNLISSIDLLDPMVPMHQCFTSLPYLYLGFMIFLQCSSTAQVTSWFFILRCSAALLPPELNSAWSFNHCHFGHYFDPLNGFKVPLWSFVLFFHSVFHLDFACIHLLYIIFDTHDLSFHIRITHLYSFELNLYIYKQTFTQFLYLWYDILISVASICNFLVGLQSNSNCITYPTSSFFSFQYIINNFFIVEELFLG